MTPEQMERSAIRIAAMIQTAKECVIPALMGVSMGFKLHDAGWGLVTATVMIWLVSVAERFRPTVYIVTSKKEGEQQ